MPEFHERTLALSPDMQDEVARVTLGLVGDEEQVISLTPDERAAIEWSREAAARGDFATGEEFRAVWASIT